MLSWHRWREPLAVVLLVAVIAMLGVQVAGFVVSWQVGDASGLLSVPADDLLPLALAATVLWCTTPVLQSSGTDRAPSRHARSIAVAALVVMVATVLGWLTLALWNVLLVLAAPTPPSFLLFVIEGLLQLVVPAAATVAVGLAVRGARTSQTSEQGLAQPVLATPSVEEPPERLPAAWQADEATGAVWLTADDAAQGRPGLSWSDPAEGWAPGPPAQTPAAEDDDLR